MRPFAAIFALAVVSALPFPARAARQDAAQQYDVRGEDLYRVGSDSLATRVEYLGTQTLTQRREGDRVRYEATAGYTVTTDGATSHETARFVQVLLPSGSFQDAVDSDPDFLTVLDQPFAVVLDRATLRELRNLHAPVPFDAASPLGGNSVLHGYLRPATAGKLQGVETVAVRFEADGPMSAPMPIRTSATMSGQMHMSGTAYYASGDAMLQALDVTLTIVAHLHETGRTQPVRIVYRRSMRALSPQAGRARTLPPIAPPSGGETAPPAFR